MASSVISRLWYLSKLSRMPFKISTVSLQLGSSICIGLKRLASASSFSKYFLYSFMVVAPMVCISPRARRGFIMLPASMLPSEVSPAPTIWCISSMKSMTFPSFVTRSMTFFILSSKSPRYLVPATMPERSSERSFLPFKESGTSLFAMACASPSTTAVLPTPASPMRMGLFLVFLERTCIILSISAFRPITGSILPSLAFLVRSSQ